MKKVVCALAFIASGCSATAVSERIEIDRMAKPRFSVGCQTIQKDAFGKIVAPAKCWVMALEEFPARVGLDGPEYTLRSMPLFARLIFEVDNGGANLVRGKHPNSPCDRVRTARVGVDQKDISSLSGNQLIEAALSGDRIYVEHPRPWPYCNYVTYSVTTSGAREAFDEMIRKWQNR